MTIEGRADRAHDQVLVGGDQRAPVAARARSARRSTSDEISRNTKTLKASPVIGDAEQPGQAEADTSRRTGTAAPRRSRPRCCAGVGQDDRADRARPARARRRSARRPGTRCPRAAASCRSRRRSCPLGSTCAEQARPRSPSAIQLDGERDGEGRGRAGAADRRAARQQRHDDLQGRKVLARSSLRRRSRSVAPGSRLPRSCRRPRGCARRAPGRARASRRRRRSR